MTRGGYRSGARRPASYAKTNQYLGLDVRALHRRGLLATGSSFSWTWNWGEETVGTIGVRIPESWMVHLDHRRNGDLRHKALPICHSFCHYGGTRPWSNLPPLRASRGNRLSRQCHWLPAVPTPLVSVAVRGFP